MFCCVIVLSSYIETEGVPVKTAAQYVSVIKNASRIGGGAATAIGHWRSSFKTATS